MACIEFFFRGQYPIPILGEDLIPLVMYIGLPVVVITQNRCKKSKYVNGITGTVQFFRGDMFYLKSGENTIPIFPIYNEQKVKYYPLRPAYATTIQKVQEQTLNHVTLVFDMRSLTAGMGYVAISCVQFLDKVVPMFQLSRQNFTPAA